MSVMPVTKCEYGTGSVGNPDKERCDNDATREYIPSGEPIFLCREHYQEVVGRYD